jgi:putative glutathione S-transferase
MGRLVDGKWTDQWHDTRSTGGRFVRPESVFRNWITPDGGPGPSGEAGFAAGPDRYHLYVAEACPWANRTLIFRTLKGLRDMITLSVVNPIMGSHGWTFAEGLGVVPDIVPGTKYLYEVYLRADPSCSGRVTVPTLWDKDRGTIVSNESSEIIRMFNSAFDQLGASEGDYYPFELREEIDSINERVYAGLNNCVYRAGFATSQPAYEEAFDQLFATLDWMEERLSRQRYLAGEQITEADWRAFTTLARFDLVYFGHFKCNKKRIVDYPSLWGYVRDLYQQPGIATTINPESIKLHYYGSHRGINPSGIVPLGPDLAFTLPHGRDRGGLAHKRGD